MGVGIRYEDKRKKWPATKPRCPLCAKSAHRAADSASPTRGLGPGHGAALLQRLDALPRNNKHVVAPLGRRRDEVENRIGDVLGGLRCFQSSDEFLGRDAEVLGVAHDGSAATLGVDHRAQGRHGQEAKIQTKPV